MMKLWKIFSAEFGYQVGSIATWLYFTILLVFAFSINLLTATNDGVNANAPYYIAGLMIFGGLIWLMLGGPIAGEAAARDVQSRMYPLTYTAPVTKLNYLSGRFFAAFAVNALLLLSLPLGLLLSFYLPGIDQSEVGPFRLSAYTSVYFLISLPNAFVATSLQFAVAALSRRVMTSYLASLLLAIFAQLVALTLAALLGNWDLVKLLDPVGIAGIVNNEFVTWTPAEKNIRLLTLEGMFLWNRVLWLSVGVASLVLAYFRFSFLHSAGSRRWSLFRRKPEAEKIETARTEIAETKAIAVPQVERRFGFETSFRQTLIIAWTSFLRIARNPVGLTLVGLIALVSAAFGSRIMSQFGIPLIPTTQQVLDYFTSPVGDLVSAWVVIPLLIMYFAGELVWSEREGGLGDIADATPVLEWPLLTGRFLGLTLVIFVWMALLMTGGILMQLAMNYTNFEIGLYVQMLFGIQFIDYLLFALFALVIHVVVNQKYIGYMAVLLVLLYIAFPSTLKIEHNMLIFGSDPGWWYSDMRGFGKTLWPWFWFKAYWIAWALLLAVAARVLWARGREQSFKSRLKGAKHSITSTSIRTAIFAMVLLLSTGGFIFYNTNVLNEYQTSSDMLERKAEYERRYGRYRDTPQPQLSGTNLQVEIYPDQQRIEIRAIFTLLNTDTVAMDSIHLGGVSGIEVSEVNFNRKAAEVLNDKKLSHAIYTLDQPLLPGDSLELKFAVQYQQLGFDHRGTNTMVLTNGTYFTNFDLLPSVGYQRYRELNDPDLRKKYQLVERPVIPSLYDPEARKKPAITDQNSFEAIVGTAKDEVAVAPGTLLRSWTEGDRSYWHFKTDASLRGEYSIVSAKYAVRESQWNNVAVRIYYHPGHSLNIDRMLRSAKASLEYYTDQFGPYPYQHITIVEQGAGGGASSEASMIDYGEQYALMNPDDGPEGFDLPFYILAHEFGHQWFGGAQLRPANVEGAGVLIEGLAVYAGMQVLEKNYGEGHLQQYVDFLHSFYEIPRSLATPPLLQANESFLYYRKGGLAMYAISKYIGKAKVNGALQSMLRKHSSGVLPVLTTLDLYHELESVTPDSLHYLLHDLFEKNTYWRLKTKQFEAEQIKGGNWEVTLNVQAHKVTIDSTGYEQEVPMNDWLEVGIYEDGQRLREPLYLQMHHIKSGEQTIKVTVPRKPARGGIDPNQLMIDLKLHDNVMRLKEDHTK